MNANQSKSGFFTEDQSLKVIREMIRVSQRKLRNDGILFILWGWIMFIYYLIYYLESKMITTYQMEKILNYTGTALILGGLAYTIYYLLKQRKRVQTYIGVSLRYVWISLIVSLMLVNLIQFNVLHQINFELQHPIFMVIIAFAIVATGGIIRYRLIIAGGIVFGIMAFISSWLPLEEQLLVEAIAWAIAFVFPGHILYSKRNK
jgi:hypothetical protein